MAKSSKHVEQTETPVTMTVEPAPTTPTVTALAVQTVLPQPNELTEGQEAELRAFTTKSSQMRYLAGLGWKNGPIAKKLTQVWGKTVIYQHVRNVLRQPLKKS